MTITFRHLFNRQTVRSVDVVVYLYMFACVYVCAYGPGSLAPLQATGPAFYNMGGSPIGGSPWTANKSLDIATLS